MTDREVPDWLTEMDKEIINVLGTNLILSPSIIAENIGRSREGVGNRLNSLQAGGLVRKVDRGKYELTEEGYKYMDEWSDLDEEYHPWHGKTEWELRNSDSEES
ncbi:MarR family transcriptional regulator [Haloarcula japonica]|uniref:MarR family transcriptional regulator n=1 Tax=Haloarcula japonica TaxID=29282 RepID=UPI0039F67778